jgi:pyruvyl transferase EpsI
MIFCYITNTPCLVFQNNNHKVRETYNWIRDNTNVNLIAEYSEESISYFFSQDNFNSGQLIDLSEKYEILKDLLR